jgi:hypothetical protein
VNLEKHRSKLIAARDEMNRTIAAIEIVLAYVGVKNIGGKKRGRPPSVKNSIKKGDEKIGVKKSTLTKPLRMKPKKAKKVARIRHLSAEGEARRRAGYNAYVKRMQAAKSVAA